jgi:MFS superfamily sulfate permease-like transporter
MILVIFVVVWSLLGLLIAHFNHDPLCTILVSFFGTLTLAMVMALVFGLFLTLRDGWQAMRLSREKEREKP